MVGTDKTLTHYSGLVAGLVTVIRKTFQFTVKLTLVMTSVVLVNLFIMTLILLKKVLYWPLNCKSGMAVLTAISDISRPHETPIRTSSINPESIWPMWPNRWEKTAKIARKQLPLRGKKSIKCQNGHPRPISKKRDQIHHKTRARFIYSLKMFPFPSTWEKK